MRQGGAVIPFRMASEGRSGESPASLARPLFYYGGRVPGPHTEVDGGGTGDVKRRYILGCSTSLSSARSSNYIGA